MAQDFVTSAATRVHPIEFNTGAGIGVAAALRAIQTRISWPLADGGPAHAPLAWRAP